LSIQEFEKSLSRAKKAARLGPVFIVKDGRPVYVLLSIDEYRKIGGELPSPGA
jgi:prevent-host-death family protein